MLLTYQRMLNVHFIINLTFLITFVIHEPIYHRTNNPIKFKAKCKKKLKGEGVKS